jgi:uncharacterized protein YbjT (DUF2867 family)
MILISGASGMTGEAIIKKLKGRGEHVVALVRSDKSGERLMNIGADSYRIGNMRDAASLDAAMKGIEKVYHICPRMQPDEEEIGLRMIAAAKKAGVGYFGFHSVIRSAKPQIVFHWAKLQVDIALAASGLPFFVMQPTNYMENVTWTWPLIAEQGEYLLPYRPDVRMTWVTVDDVGEAIANALTDQDRYQFGSYELSGPDGAISRHEVCAMLTRALGREVRGTSETIAEYFERPRFAGRLKTELERLATMFEEYDRQGLLAGSSVPLTAILGRKPMGYYEWIDRYVATLAA